MRRLINLIKLFVFELLLWLLRGAKGKTSVETERNFRKLPDGTVLPGPFKNDEVKNLINQIHSFPDIDNRFVYDTVLVSALNQLQPLLDLYDLIPRIWKGDSTAESEFNTVLSQHSASRTEISSYEERAEKSMQVIRGEIPAPGGGSPCKPLFLLKPDTIFSIQQTATLLAGDNRKKQVSHLATIDKIWEGALCPDVFNYLAQQDKLNGGTQLYEISKSLAEKSDYFNKVEQLKNQRNEANGGNVGLTQPPPEENGPWRPPKPGHERPPMGCGPDDGPVPDRPEFPEDCKLIRDYCKDFLRGAGRGIRRVPDSVSVDKIDNVSSVQVCAGDIITITGSNFGHSQGSYDVVFGTTKADVVSWTDTEIRVRVPSGIAGRFCIGIRNGEKENNRHDVHEQNRKAFEEFSEGASVCLVQPDAAGMLPYRPDTPDCVDVNVVNVGAPTAYFRGNGGIRSTMESGSDIILEWAVTNADSMKISRKGFDGPTANITGPMTGQKNIGPFNAGSELTATYKLEASNSCGTLTKEVEVTAVRTPQLSILGIEVTQAIQRFNRNNPGQNNSVRLVSEKRTMVRVYVDSGVTDGFDFGQGANILPDVTGHLTLTYPGGNTVTVNNMINPGKINAQPPGSVNRGNLEHSVNFELPLNNLDGTIQIDAEIYTDPRSGSGRRDRQSTSVTFRHNARIRLVAILINDTVNGNAAPNMSNYFASLQGARTRLPVRESGFVVTRASNHMTINTQSDEDLTSGNGWSNLLDRLDDIADDYQNNDEIWTGLVPNVGAYAWNGLANDGIVKFWWDKHPRMLSKARQGATFAHELSHTVSIDHADSMFSFRRVLNNTGTNIIRYCGIGTPGAVVNLNLSDGTSLQAAVPVQGEWRINLNPPLPTSVFVTNATQTIGGNVTNVLPGVSRCNCARPANIDSTLVSLTEDIGVDVAAYRLMPQGIPTLMTYCTPNIGGTANYQDRWMSIDLWNRLWSQI